MHKGIQEAQIEKKLGYKKLKSKRGKVRKDRQGVRKIKRD